MKIWLRAVRVRFLTSSILSVVLGCSISYYVTGMVNLFDMALVASGVVLLHASVDLLNDYTDYKRGIDQNTRRTPLSGGTGVLPEGLLEPAAVRRAAMVCLAGGLAVGSYYVYQYGVVIAILLGLAALSIWFYSTKISDSGLGEFFVGVKGSLIVLGSYYIQAGGFDMAAILGGVSRHIPTISATQAGGFDMAAILGGVAAGSLSSMVLLAASFPDIKADRAAGRRTLAVRLERRAAYLGGIFPALFCTVILYGVVAGHMPTLSLAALAALPLGISAILGLARESGSILPHIGRTVLYSRISVMLLLATFFAAAAFWPIGYDIAEAAGPPVTSFTASISWA